jgi:hypothetical protein
MHDHLMHRLALAGSMAAATLLACSHPPPPVARPVAVPSSASASAPPVGELGPLVRLGLLEDHVGFVDHEVVADGIKDFGFRIRISGEVLGFTLTASDTKGKPLPGACWDTYVGTTPMPPLLEVGLKVGGETAVLGVVDAKGTLLNPKGSLPPHTFHDELVTLWCPDPDANYFHEGRAFTLLVLRPGNRVDRSTVVIV